MKRKVRAGESSAKRKFREGERERPSSKRKVVGGSGAKKKVTQAARVSPSSKRKTREWEETSKQKNRGLLAWLFDEQKEDDDEYEYEEIVYPKKKKVSKHQDYWESEPRTFSSMFQSVGLKKVKRMK